MATITIQPVHTSVASVVRYLMHGPAHSGDGPRYWYASSYGSTPATLVRDMRTTREIYRQREVKRQAFALVQSFSTKEHDEHPDAPEKVHELGFAFARRAFPGRQFLVVTQRDGAGGMWHNHLIVSNVAFEDYIFEHTDGHTDGHGKKTARRFTAGSCVPSAMTGFARLMHVQDTMLADAKAMGSLGVEPYDNKALMAVSREATADRTTTLDIALRASGAYNWRDDLRARIRQVAVEATSIDEFAALLAAEGIGVRQRGKEGHLSYGFTDADGKARQARGGGSRGLGDDFARPGVEAQIERNIAKRAGRPTQNTGHEDDHDTSPDTGEDEEMATARSTDELTDELTDEQRRHQVWISEIDGYGGTRLNDWRRLGRAELHERLVEARRDQMVAVRRLDHLCSLPDPSGDDLDAVAAREAQIADAAAMVKEATRTSRDHELLRHAWVMRFGGHPDEEHVDEEAKAWADEIAQTWEEPQRKNRPEGRKDQRLGKAPLQPATRLTDAETRSLWQRQRTAAYDGVFDVSRMLQQVTRADSVAAQIVALLLLIRAVRTQQRQLAEHQEMLARQQQAERDGRDPRRFRGEWAETGEEVCLRRDELGHHFDDDECRRLLGGEDVSFTAKATNGSEQVVTGRADTSTWTGGDGEEHATFGFHYDPSRSFNRTFGGHRFTDDEVDRLLEGQDVIVKATAKSGKAYFVRGGLGERLDQNGATRYGFQRSRQVDAEWGGHAFTPLEAERLMDGESISFEAVRENGTHYMVSGRLIETAQDATTSVGFRPDPKPMPMKARMPRDKQDQPIDLVVVTSPGNRTKDGKTQFCDVQLHAQDPLAAGQRGLHLSATKQDERTNLATPYSTAQYETMRKAAGGSVIVLPDGREVFAVRATVMPAARGDGLVVNCNKPIEASPVALDREILLRQETAQRAAQEAAQEAAASATRKRQATYDLTDEAPSEAEHSMA